VATIRRGNGVITALDDSRGAGIPNVEGYPENQRWKLGPVEAHHVEAGAGPGS
jgi:hypothetical protein